MRYSLILFLFAVSISACDQSKPNVIIADPPAEQEHSNDIRHHLTRVATGITQNSLATISSQADWDAVKSKRLEEFTEIDYTLSYDLSLSSVSLGAGLIWYQFPDDDDDILVESWIRQ